MRLIANFDTQDEIMEKLPDPIEPKLPIAIRNEHIAPYPTTIRIKRHFSILDGGDFTISTCVDDEAPEDKESKLFYVDSDLVPGRGLSQRRSFLDASGLPVFTLATKGNGASSYTWHVELPGDSTAEPVAVLAPRWDLFTNKMHVYVMNAADNGAEVKLEVRGLVMFWKFTTEVYLDGALVVSAKVKDIRHSQWLVKVARGFDVSLVGHCL